MNTPNSYIDFESIQYPPHLQQIKERSDKIGFKAICDDMTGCLLRTLTASKPEGKILEIGTGTGISTAWILAGMDDQSTLHTIEDEAKPLEIAKTYLGSDPRIIFHSSTASQILEEQAPASFDLIFADAYVGKFGMLSQTLDLLKPGGLYIVDDLARGTEQLESLRNVVLKFVNDLEQHPYFELTKLHWSTGLFIASRRAAPKQATINPAG